MDRDNENIELPAARAIPPDRMPRRGTLLLDDGYETSIYEHRSVGAPEGSPVLYAHGVQSHPGWFIASAAALAQNGRRVFQVTRRGSGVNTHSRGHAPSAKRLLDDIRTSVDFILERTGARRIHLMGVSWGGKLLAAYLAGQSQSQQDRFASLTLIAPGIASLVDVSPATKCGIVLSLVVCPRKEFDIPLNDVDLFTDNESMLAYLRADPFRLNKATARFLYSSHCLDRLLSRAASGCIRVPTTLILARRDRIIDNVATRRIVERLTEGAPVVKEFDSAHTLEFAADPQQFYDALNDAVDHE